MYNNDHKKYRIVNKFRFYSFVVSLFIVIFIICYSFIADAQGLSDVNIEAVYIESGDTLWSICRRFVDNKTDIRKYIDEVIEYNNLKSAILKPGQLIYVPVHNQ